MAPLRRAEVIYVPDSETFVVSLFTEADALAAQYKFTEATLDKMTPCQVGWVRFGLDYQNLLLKIEPDKA